MKAAAAVVAFALGTALAAEAAAQGHSVVACRDRNMNIVACDTGGGGADYSGGGGGGLVGLFFRSLFDLGASIGEANDAAAQAEAEAAAARAQQAAQQRQAFLADQERRKQETAAEQAAFARQQRDLVGMVRPLGESGGQTGALPQLRAIELGIRDISAQPPEAAAAAAGAGFDRSGASPVPSGPLMQVTGVPKVDPNAPPPVAADPMLKPMTLDQRMVVAEGRTQQKKLDELRAKKAKGEIDAATAAREEAALLDALNALAQRFAALTSQDPGAPPSPQVALQPGGAPPRLANLVGAAKVGSCAPSDPARIGCLEIRNTTAERMRVYIRELPGVFCTVQPGTYCSRPVSAGVYHGYAEFDDGRRTSDAALDLKPQGLSWTVALQ